MKQKNDEGRRTLGPVSDLERHLPSDWWRHLFNSVYLKTDGDVVENEAATEREVEVLARGAGLEPNDRILDLCCGQGRHALSLARRGFRHVTGVDRSRYLIRLARRRATKQGLSVRFHEGDARRFRHSGEPFHTVLLLGNSFGYFDLEDDDESVLRTVKRVLVPGGTLALDITNGLWIRENFQPRSWEWADQNHLVCRERALSTDADRLITREVVVHSEKGIIADQFYAERLYSLPRITRLLERQGFDAVRDQGVIQGESTRGMDLGMMANRLFLTARAPRHQRTAPSPTAPIKVAVLLGDPRLPDPVKRDGQFNTEDLETIQRLKDALDELDGYDVRYLDDHASLHQTLRQDPPAFVLNFCDEGFDNDALKELHIPAMLETLGTPYSGAGPACLGLCYDKSLVRAIAESLDIPVPLESYIGRDDTSATLPSTFPALVKPNRGDSSVGITQRSVVHDAGELLAYIAWLRETYGRQGILVQEFLSGPECTVGIVGNPGQSLQVLPVLEVDYSNLDPSLPQILCYESKWHPDSPYWTRLRYREAKLSGDASRQLVDHSIALFERLGCQDYARFDFRSDDQGTIKLLEVNPNPGWCWDGKLNLMAEFGGMRYPELLRAILDAAFARLSAQRSSAPTREPSVHRGSPRVDGRPRSDADFRRVAAGRAPISPSAPGRGDATRSQ